MYKLYPAFLQYLLIGTDNLNVGKQKMLHKSK